MADLDVTFTQLSQLSRAYGAPAVEIAERVLQRSAVGAIGGGVLLMVAGAALAFAAVKAVTAGIAETKKSYDRENFAVSAGGIVGGLFCSVAAVVALVTGALSLIDVWAWTALTDPQLALAHRIFGSMGG